MKWTNYNYTHQCISHRCPRQIGPIGCGEKEGVGFIIGIGSHYYEQVPWDPPVSGWIEDSVESVMSFQSKFSAWEPREAKLRQSQYFRPGPKSGGKPNINDDPGQRQSGRSPYSLEHQLFYSIQTFNYMDEAHQHWGWQSALLHLPMQLLILSRNT